ncbi:hypothetical protein LUX57_49315 [Actinomadura madurae]|nr:hypothetical protein [Actinomadura madurae]MCP9972099.1 hypothetical protein [Actinomadura madurae]
MSVASGGIAARQTRRMSTARSSSQSCSTCDSRYRSPPDGTSAKKSPATSEQRPGEPPGREPAGRARHRAGQVQQPAVRPRHPLQQACEQFAVATADVDDPPVRGEVDGAEDLVELDAQPLGL